jgi:hypothetical protein
MDGAISEAVHGSVALNSSKLAAADGYVADSEGAWNAFKSASKTLGQGNYITYGTKAQVAADALREGTKMNSMQNGPATADTLSGEEPTPPAVDLPL